ncbi:hypothetical protein B0H13DRAFT_2394892 [Mycena leptocephala]|nr:hypothetical protein B0H13DRAFT_2394892 [Mycena leptocephala]
MVFEGGWVAAMARPDHVGNYKCHRPTRRQRHALPARSLSPPFVDARSSTSSLRQGNQQGSSRRSASPDSRRGFPARLRSPPPFRSLSGRPEYMQELLARRADFLDDLREWAAQITHDVVLWRLPMEFGWNMQFLKDGYLIVSEAAEVRLRMIAVMTPGSGFYVMSGTRHGTRNRLQHRAAIYDLRLEPGSSPAQTHARWLTLLGDIAALENVYHGGGNDSADDDSMGLRWDELSENDYQCIYGYVAGPTREKDAWMYPPDDMLEDLSKHYYREWNPIVDDLFRRIKAEWEDRPCRGKLRTRNQWKDFIHSSNHGRFAPEIEVNAVWIQEAKSRLSRAFVGSWNKRRIWEIAIPETFKQDF